MTNPNEAGATPLIAVCISSQSKARIHACAAIKLAGLMPVEVRPDDLARFSVVPAPAALIYQPTTGNDKYLDDLIALSNRHPEIPILLYLRVHSSVGRVVTYAGTNGRFHFELELDQPDEVVRLEATIAFMLRTTLKEAFLVALRPALHVEQPDVDRFVRFALAKLTGLPPHPPNVEAVAAMVGISVRTLEGRCPDARMPLPKALLDFVTLLWITYVAEEREVTTVIAAKDLGLGRTSLQRLRTRLLPDVSLASLDPSREFNAVLEQLMVRRRELENAAGKEKKSKRHKAG